MAPGDDIQRLEQALKRIAHALARNTKERDDIRAQKKRLDKRDPALEQREKELAAKRDEIVKRERETVKRIKELKHRQETVEQRLERERKEKAEAICLDPGDPCWGGSKGLVEAKCAPVAEKHGITRTSAKRRETYGNPGSDHHISQLLAYALDFAITNGFWLRDEMARALGITAAIRDYAAYYVEWAGHTFRFQFIAATHGTGPHLHVGCERID